jgi:hypothetical protein
VQIAFTGDTTELPIFTEFTASARNAIEMAIERHPTIRGFRVQLNTVETTCLNPDNTAAAAAIVGNGQNTAVLGHLCSFASQTALPIYEAAGVVVISGSASAGNLPALAPTVFNRTVPVNEVDGDPGALWLARVSTLPSVLEWEREYSAEFGSAPALEPLSVLYFDAAELLLRRLQQVSRTVGGNLVIDRNALASAVRNTTRFGAVSCSVTLDRSTGNRVIDNASLDACAEG